MVQKVLQKVGGEQGQQAAWLMEALAERTV